MELLIDRNYWRMQPDARLIEEARDSNHELCIVLGERLDDVVRDCDYVVGEQRERADDLQREANRLADRLDDALDKIDELELMLSQRETEIEQLKETDK